MEFEKLQEIIAEVLNVDPEEITMDTTFVDDLGADSHPLHPEAPPMRSRPAWTRQRFLPARLTITSFSS